MAKIAIFDMDGTLIDSGRDITCSINYVRLHQYGLEPLSIATVVQAINAPSRNLAEIFYLTPIYEEKARAMFEEHYHSQCIESVYAYQGIPELLEILKSHGTMMGVATNAPTVFAERMLSHLKINTFFDLIIGADKVSVPKPDPQMLLAHLDHYGFIPGTDYAYMIGDNMKDMQAAKNAGIKSIFASWGFATEDFESDHLAMDPLSVSEIILQ